VTFVYNIFSVIIFCYNLRFNNNIFFISFALIIIFFLFSSSAFFGGNTFITFVLQYFLGNSISL